MATTKQVMDKVDRVLEWAKDYKERNVWADKFCVKKAMYNPGCLGEGDPDWSEVRAIAEKEFKKFCEGKEEKEKEVPVEEGEKPRVLKKEIGDPRIIEGGLFGENLRRK